MPKFFLYIDYATIILLTLDLALKLNWPFLESFKEELKIASNYI